MTRLEKKAWDNLGGALICIIIAGPGIPLLVHMNTTSISFLMGGVGGLIGALIAGLISYRRAIKSWAKFDEREQKIVAKARALSSCVFILFMYCASFAVFYIVGAKNPVPAYLLPTLFISGLLLMLFVQSAAIFIQLAKERYNE
jgi:hypothetical protein